jgi:hypothetical protein
MDHNEWDRKEWDWGPKLPPPIYPVKPWTRREKWLDSYYHYRDIVKLNPVHAFYRACYFELLKREPWS